MTLEEQLKCAKRELSMRKSVYPYRVSHGNMTQKSADHEIKAMRAIVRTLEGLISDEHYRRVTGGD
jgi:hypothetical protein